MLKHSSTLVLVLSCALVGACAADAPKVSTDIRDIVGGQDADIADLPWQISLQTTSGFHFCGGSVIDPEWILTAAHCVVGSNPGSLRVAAGMTRLSDTDTEAQIRSVSDIFVFPGYIDVTLGKDAALLRLAEPLDTSSALVEAIPFVTEEDAAGGLTDPDVVSLVSGWGTLSSGGPSPDVLQVVDVPIVSNEVANAAYEPFGFPITDDQLGAGLMGVGGKDACQGDSGGPLIVPNADGTGFLVAGIVSWGFGCAEADFPGMYGRVSSFATWIADILSGNIPEPPPPAEPEALENNVPVADLAAATNTQIDFFLEVPEGTQTLTFTISGGVGDADLYVRFGAVPTLDQFDCRPFIGGNEEECVFENPEPGTWFASLQAFTSFQGVSLVGSFGDVAPPPPPGCEDGQVYAGTLANEGDIAFEPADGPVHDGFNYFGSLFGTSATLSGTGLDFDLFLFRWQNNNWEQVAVSAGGTSDESISFEGPGHYAYVVSSFSGTGDYTMCLRTEP